MTENAKKEAAEIRENAKNEAAEIEKDMIAKARKRGPGSSPGGQERCRPKAGGGKAGGW